jgi:hypothetical protein
LAQRVISAELKNVIDLPVSELAKYSGFYQKEDQTIEQVIVVGNKLMVRQAGGYIYQLQPLSKTKFHRRTSINSHSEFSFDGNKVMSIEHVNGEQRLMSKKVAMP